MTDHLSDVFRANVRAELEARSMSPEKLSLLIGADRMQARTQIFYRAGKCSLTLATVERYATALGIEPAVLLTPGGVQRRRAVKVA